ncbi:MAG TPA: PrsW family glutamic-type intramembrane protease [Bacteroidota bacterium]
MIYFSSVLAIGVSLTPVFLFLVSLILLDSYKLVKARSVSAAILYGCLVAGVSYFLNTWVQKETGVDFRFFTRYVSPITEEVLKALFLVYLIRRKQIGFMVDATIYGFAIGAGFAFIENLYYLTTSPDAQLLLWVVRGFGTAVMHGGTTAIVALLAKRESDALGSEHVRIFWKGMLIAILIHSYYNHFFFHPLFSPFSIIVGLPATLTLVFQQSEKATREWLGVGFDTDVQLLQLITSGNLPQTRIGTYLKTLQSRFRGEIIADLICYLQIYLELSIRAKGILLMREAGFTPPSEPDTKEKFAELRYLEGSIGTTGKLALHPFLHTSSRNLWQLNMLQR